MLLCDLASTDRLADVSRQSTLRPGDLAGVEGAVFSVPLDRGQ